MKNSNQFKMILKLMFGVCFVLASLQQIEAQCPDEDICNPPGCCTALGIGVKVPNPTDCYSYYLCINNAKGEVVPSDVSIQCDDGNYFDTATNDCNKGTGCLIPCANRKCDTVCTADFETLAYPNDCNKYYVCVPGQYGDPTPTNCSDPEAPYFNGETCIDNPYECCDICTPFCPDKNIEVVDPYNCKGYYLCTTANTKPSDDYKFLCSTGFYFDPEEGVCIDDGDEECKSIC